LRVLHATGNLAHVEVRKVDGFGGLVHFRKGRRRTSPRRG
jgi:hypothetical protein